MDDALGSRVDEHLDEFFEAIVARSERIDVPADLLASLTEAERAELFARRQQLERAASAGRAGTEGRAGGPPFDEEIPGFTLLERIGGGAQGIVYRALDRGLNRTVAIKLARESAADDIEGLSQRLQTEATTLSRIRHDNVVATYSCGHSRRGLPYLAMEFVDGQSLADVLSHRDWADPRLVARLLRILAHAAHALHTEGVVHRDLKPANIRFRAAPDAVPIGASEVPGFGRPVVLDLGLAWATDRPNPALTSQSELAGTLPYTAPEQVDPERRAELSGCTDVWALGVILHELLFGTLPFPGRHGLISDDIRTREPEAFRRRHPRDRADLVAICRRCLEKLPSRRYASALELAADLDRFLSGEPTLVRPRGTAELLGRALWRRRLAIGTFGVVLLSATTATWISIASASRSARNARIALEALTTVSDRIVVDPRLDRMGLNDLQADLASAVLPSLESYADSEDASAGDALRAKAMASIALGQQAIGRGSDALVAAERAVAILARLSSEVPADDRLRFALAVARARCGILAGSVLEDAARAQLLLEQAADELRAIRPDLFPDEAGLALQSAMVAMNIGNAVRRTDPSRSVGFYRDAIEHFRAFAAESDDHRLWLVKATSNLALVRAELEEWDAADAAHRVAVELSRNYLQQVDDAAANLDPERGDWVTRHLQYREAHAIALTNLGEFLCLRGRESEAEPLLREALRHYESLATAAPSNFEFPWSVAMAKTNVARALVPGSGTPAVAAEAGGLSAAAEHWYALARRRHPQHAVLVEYHTQTRLVAVALAQGRGDESAGAAIVARTLAEFDEWESCDEVLAKLAEMAIAVADRLAPAEATVAWQRVLRRLDGPEIPEVRWRLLAQARLTSRLATVAPDPAGVAALDRRAAEALARYRQLFGDDRAVRHVEAEVRSGSWR